MIHKMLDEIDGEMPVCSVCGGENMSLPTDCPGDKMTYGQECSVFYGTHDFIGGQWTEL